MPSCCCCSEVDAVPLLDESRRVLLHRLINARPAMQITAHSKAARTTIMSAVKLFRISSFEVVVVTMAAEEAGGEGN